MGVGAIFIGGAGQTDPRQRRPGAGPALSMAEPHNSSHTPNGGRLGRLVDLPLGCCRSGGRCRPGPGGGRSRPGPGGAYRPGAAAFASAAPLSPRRGSPFVPARPPLRPPRPPFAPAGTAFAEAAPLSPRRRRFRPGGVAVRPGGAVERRQPSGRPVGGGRDLHRWRGTNRPARATTTAPTLGARQRDESPRTRLRRP
jgi:hypothetical protein